MEAKYAIIVVDEFMSGAFAGSEVREAWQTLKSAVLAAQTTNSQRDETVRSCDTCGSGCPDDGKICEAPTFSEWEPRTASPV